MTRVEIQLSNGVYSTFPNAELLYKPADRMFVVRVKEADRVTTYLYPVGAVMMAMTTTEQP